MKKWYVYILASKKDGVLYVWVTSNLIKRVYEHKKWLAEWFTKRYFVKKLVYFEDFEDIYDAICREKQLKSWNRKRKIKLIEKDNPNWNDLFQNLV